MLNLVGQPKQHAVTVERSQEMLGCASDERRHSDSSHAEPGDVDFDEFGKRSSYPPSCCAWGVTYIRNSARSASAELRRAWAMPRTSSVPASRAIQRRTSAELSSASIISISAVAVGAVPDR